MSEEEVFFDRMVIGRNKLKKSSKGASAKSTPDTSPRRPKSVPTAYQTTDEEQKIWTLPDMPKSTPLMIVTTRADSPRTEAWTVNEIPESNSPDSSLTTSSQSDLSPTTAPGLHL